MPQHYPFSAVLGCEAATLDDMGLALVLTTISPVIGGVLWFLLGRGRKSGQSSTRRTVAPDDDPEFLGSSRRPPSDLDRETTDERIRRLEQELSDLDGDDATGAQGSKP